MDNAPKPPSTDKSFMLIVVIIIVAVLAGLGGYWVGLKKQPVSVTYLGSTNASDPDAWPKSVVTSQDATAVGKIIKSENNTLTLEGSDGKQVTFKVSPDITIYSPTASASAKLNQNLSDLTPGKKVVLSLHLVGKDYLVVTATFLTK